MRCRSPNGPERQSIIATTSPTTTGGRAMPVLTMLIAKDRPRNFPSASQVPSGSPISRLIIVEMPETARESRVISRTSGLSSISLRDSQFSVCLSRVREEQWLTVFFDAEFADDLLTFVRSDEIRKGSSRLEIDARPFFGVDRDHVIDIQQEGIAFHEDV